jgi:hypothetical protein
MTTNVRVGFTDSRTGVLEALYRMGATLCAYSSGDKWADRCDCKYGIGDRWPTVGEKGNGCPELRTLYGLIAAMTDGEWALLVKRAGGTLIAAILDGPDVGSRLIRAETATDQAAAWLERAREALAGKTSEP